MPSKRELAEINVNSMVMISRGYSCEICKVDGETPTQWIVGNERYRKKDGYRVGSTGYRRSYIICVATDSDREKIIPTSDLEKAYQLLRPDAV